MSKNQKHNELNIWEDPTIFKQGQVKPHTPIVPFNDEKEARNSKKDQSQLFKSLNGDWYFKWSENLQEAPDEFYNSEYDVGGWDKISVPSCWQMEGYGYPMFRNVAHTFISDPPRVPHDFNPVGSYVRKFQIPENWLQKKILLRFEGVKSASFVYLNGQKVGYNQGGMEPAEYDITDYLQTGENKLAVKVLRYSDGTYMECQDMWRLAGIYRDVYLTAVPRIHIRDYFVQTKLDDNYEDANLDISVEIQHNLNENRDNELRKYSLLFKLYDTEGDNIVHKKASLSEVEKSSPGLTTLKFRENIKNPQKWSAEYPNLYDFTLELITPTGETGEVVADRIGFREIEIKNQALYVNGVQVKLNGVNSHMHHPETGRRVDKETLCKDLILMKQFNINCVRTSHYPPEPEYLALADELGMYIIDETGDEAHAAEFISDKPEWKQQYLDRMRRMVYRDRNHPSVIMWSAGNESGWGENICSLIKEGKEIDPTRPGWMYGGNQDGDPRNNPIKCEDIVGPRYQKPFLLKNRFGRIDSNIDDRPSFMDEYLSAAGNGLGGLDEYWDVIRDHPRLTGGAIWDWVSPGIKKDVITIPDKAEGHIQCTLMGQARVVETEQKNVLQLSGHDDWVEVYQSPYLDITGDELSLYIKVKPKKSQGENTFITKGSYQFGIIENNNENLEFYIGGQNRTSLEVELPRNWWDSWHELMGVLADNQLKIYIDGVLAGTRDCSHKITNTPFPVQIGRDIQKQGQDDEEFTCSAEIEKVGIFAGEIEPDQLEKLNNPESEKETRLWLDFESKAKEGYFFSRGREARTYGLIWPDRKIKPELWQVKKSAQPVKISKQKQNFRKYEIQNLHHFRNLAELNCSWKLTEQGSRVKQQGQLEIELPPGDSKVIEIPFHKPEITDDSTDYFLTIQFTLPERKSWAEKGHEIAWAQFNIPFSDSFLELKSETENNESDTSGSSKKLEVKEDLEGQESIIVSGEDFKYTFDTKTGQLSEASKKGKLFISSGPRFNVWRPPVANELDSWCMFHMDLPHQSDELGDNVASAWRAVGLDKLKTELDNISLKTTDRKVQLTADQILSANYYNTGFEIKFKYIIDQKGVLTVRVKVLPRGQQPCWLPKAGLQMRVPRQFSNLRWYGRGPFSTYPDRKSGAKIGIYESSVEQEYEPYLIPQDYGNKTEVKRVDLEDDQGRGLRVTGAEKFNFNARLHDIENLTRARYTYQLKDSDEITLNIDHKVSGVGGTSISVLNKYRIVPEEFDFQFTISGK